MTTNKEMGNKVCWLQRQIISQRFFSELSNRETLSFPGFYSVTIVCTEDSEKLSLAGDYLLSVSPEQLKLCKRETQNIAAIQWHLEDIPRFRLQRLCHLHDGEKIFIINVARYVCVKIGGWVQGRHISRFLWVKLQIALSKTDDG